MAKMGVFVIDQFEYTSGAFKRPTQDTKRPLAEILEIVFSIAKSIQEEDETLEECLFKSAAFVLARFYWMHGGVLDDCGKAVQSHFEGTEFELAASVFNALCQNESFHISEYQQDRLWRKRKSREIGEHKHKKIRPLKNQAIDEYIKSKAEYTQADFAENFRNRLIRSGNYDFNSAPKIDTIKRWVMGF